MLYLDVHGKIIIQWILNEKYVRVWTGLKWLSIRTSSGLL